LTIPVLGVDAGFELVGLDADGAMAAPKDPGSVAWYTLGPRPGETGNAVLAGHVDWAGKPGVFWGLGRLKPGDEVEVTAADARTYRFVVRSQQWYDAKRAPVKEVFGQSKVAEVTMITCAGQFDQASHQYTSRLVVKASLR
jgi:sortase (surface protein transpeptidase)